jgi:hypothetical protein
MTSEPEEVVKTVQEMRDTCDTVENSIYDIVLYMPNGGLSLEEAWYMSPKQRQIIGEKILEYNLKKHGKENEYIVNNREQ